TMAPDATAAVYRTIEPVTGVTSLVLVDPRDPKGGIRIASDGRPGVDTLHYFDRPVAAMDEKRLAWIARRGPNDVVHVGTWRNDRKDSERGGELRTDSRLRVSSFQVFDPTAAHVRELGSPAFSPDGKKIAFIGLDDDGVA